MAVLERLGVRAPAFCARCAVFEGFSVCLRLSSRLLAAGKVSQHQRGRCLSGFFFEGPLKTLKLDA